MDTTATFELILVRHAKSSPADASTPDHDRALDGRGRADALALGRWLGTRLEGTAPDRVLCSSAKRTRETLATLAPSLGFAPEDEAIVTFDDALYLADADDIERIARAAASGVDRVMVIGHNPGLERLAARLANEPGTTMGTSAVCRLRMGEATELLERAAPRA